MYNLLDRRVFRVRLAGGKADRLSLPQTMAALASDDIEMFSALRSHQGHAFHSFLVQLAAMAMYKAGESKMPRDSARWRQTLTELAGSETPWSLINDAVESPAFMQTPILSEKLEEKYKSVEPTPGSLDVLMTSRNHDVKVHSGWDCEPDDWIYALISVQTGGGYPGKGSYQVSRINSGYGSRGAISLSPRGRPGRRIVRDVAALLSRRDEIPRDYPMRDGGIPLLWTQPWSGVKGDIIELSELDPLYIEVCRLIRLRRDEDDRIYAVRALSEDVRINARGRKGIVGDPWLPFNQKRGAALNIGEGLFGYSRMAEYLTDENWALPTLLRPTAGEKSCAGDMEIVARGMRRGKGKTQGYHERRLPVTDALMRALGDSAERFRMGVVAAERIGEVAAVAGILRIALKVYMTVRNDEDPDRRKDDRSLAFEKKLDAVVDVDFFESLAEELSAESEDDAREIRVEWVLNQLIGRARRIHREGLDTLPVPISHRMKARARSTSLFEGALRSEKSRVRYAYERDQEDQHDTDKDTSGESRTESDRND